MMGGKSKRFLKEEAIPRIFSFVPETTRKYRLAEESARNLCIGEAFSTYEAML